MTEVKQRWPRSMQGQIEHRVAGFMSCDELRPERIGVGSDLMRGLSDAGMGYVYQQGVSGQLDRWSRWFVVVVQVDLSPATRR